MDIDFDWRVALHRSDRKSLRNAVIGRLRGWPASANTPITVIVSPRRFDPYDNGVVVEIRSDSGEVLRWDGDSALMEPAIPAHGPLSSGHRNVGFVPRKLSVSVA